MRTLPKNSTKQEFIGSEPKFFVCQYCGNLMIQEKIKNAAVNINCCGQPMQELVPNTGNAFRQEHQPVITFTGGFSANAATVNIGKVSHPMTAEHRIEWVYLYTFQGGQFKFLTAGKKSGVTFALVDEDAYAYCDRDVCQMGNGHCKFNCKRGFAAYAYCNVHGLWKFQF